MKLLSSFALASFAVLAACTAAPATESTENVVAHDETAPPACAADALSHAFGQPIQPPRFAAGLDLGAGVTRASVEAVLCAGTQKTPLDYVSWGGSEKPIEAEFDQATGTLDYLQLNPGYSGALRFESRDGQHTFTAMAGGPVMKDGAPVLFDWSGAFGPAGTEVVDALVATFAPALPAIEGDCRTSSRCFLRRVDAGEVPIAIVGSRDLGFYMVFPTTAADATRNSKSEYFYMFPQAAGVTPPSP